MGRIFGPVGICRFCLSFWYWAILFLLDPWPASFFFGRNCLWWTSLAPCQYTHAEATVCGLAVSAQILTSSLDTVLMSHVDRTSVEPWKRPPHPIPSYWVNRDPYYGLSRSINSIKTLNKSVRFSMTGVFLIFLNGSLGISWDLLGFFEASTLSLRSSATKRPSRRKTHFREIQVLRPRETWGNCDIAHNPPSRGSVRCFLKVIGDTDDILIYFQNTFKSLQNPISFNIQHFQTHPNGQREIGSKILMAQVWIASLAGWFSWCDLPVGSMSEPESHQKATLPRLKPKRLPEEPAPLSFFLLMYLDHFVRVFPAVSWIYGVEVGAWFAANQIRKTYLARVKGCFKKLLDPDSGRVYRVTFQTAGRETSWDLPSFFLVPVFFVTMIDVCFGCLICTRWSPRSHTTQRATAGWGLYPLHRPQGREVLEKVLVGAISDLWFQTCFKAFEILDDLDSQFGMITWEISSNYS